MLTDRFEDIVTLEALKTAFEKIDTRSIGIDEISLMMFEERLFANLQLLCDELISGTYAPQPLERFELPKPGTDEKRPIALGSIRDKVVQHLLLGILSPYYEGIFSNKSYAYRPQRSHIRAITRTRDFITRGLAWVVRSDIDNFFETINHLKLMELLQRQIKDSMILRLIDLFIRNGLFVGLNYHSHRRGVHQGDILSPLLSNIYLHQMDAFLERKGYEFVRFADDFVIMSGSNEHVELILKELRLFLTTINLRMEDQKTITTSVHQGFTFLGAYFKGDQVLIDPARFEKVREKLRSFVMDKYSFDEFILRISAYAKTLRLMYASYVSTESSQLQDLDDDIWEAVCARIYLAKESGEVGSKASFKEMLKPLSLFHQISDDERKRLVDLAILRGYERYHDEYPNKAKGRTDPIERKKIEYAHAFARLSTLHVTSPGVFIGISKNKYMVKERGKVIQTIPKSQIERIIINAKGVTLSSSVIESCAKTKVPIDFIDYTHTPYASILSYHAPLPQTTIRQYEIFFSGEGLYLAKEFIEGKAKNQINYLKYLDRYHKTLQPIILKMEKNLKTMKTKSTTSAEAMGFEGIISAMYWEGLQSIVDPSWGWSARVTKGAGDTVNSALNYAYAILYGKIQESLVRSGLSLYVSYLHVPDTGKPTLVFDMIEEFRAFVVDRTIITMLNRNEPIRVDNTGKLTALARKKIAENVFERLGSYTTWKKESRKITTIIQYQSYLLSRHIHGEDKYTAFIGKY
jgi:group II intron reverse transcriptase/maturase/CRISPR-associated endonuclease Cas1